jgi:hypothetical protein
VEVVNVRVVGTAERRNGGMALGAPTTLERGRVIAGPATVALEDATVRLEEGWSGVVHETGAIVVERSGPPC